MPKPFNQANMYRTLTTIEKDIREALAQTASAETETAAAIAFQALQSHLSEYLQRSGEMNREHWKLRDTALKQALTIAELDLHESGARTGEKAPGEAPQFHIQNPDTITVQNSPDFFFIRLSYGLVNIRHIVELDVKSKTLHTINSNRHLSSDDVRILLYHLKLYEAK